MPIYSYRCRKCGENFESFRGMDDNDDEVKCPRCGALKPQRVLTPVNGKTSGPKKGNLWFPT